MEVVCVREKRKMQRLGEGSGRQEVLLLLEGRASLKWRAEGTQQEGGDGEQLLGLCVFYSYHVFSNE